MRYKPIAALTAALLCSVLAACPKEQAGAGGTPQGRNLPPAAAIPPSAAASAYLPDSWPVKSFGLPAGAAPLPGQRKVAGRPFGPGCREWAVEFSYAKDWPAAVAHCDTTLKALGWWRVGGSKNTVEPLPRATAQSQRRHTEGKRLYVSPDETQFIFLHYDARPDQHSSQLIEEYKLQVVVFEQPQPILPPSYKESIELPAGA